MSEIIQITEQERKIMKLDTSEATIEDIEQFKSSPDYQVRLAQLKKTDAWTELVKRLEAKAEEKQSLEDKTKWLLNTAKSHASKPFETEGTGAADQAEYIYGVLLRHGVMPDRNIGFLTVSPDSPLWLQKVVWGIKFGLDKAPIIKWLDFPADIGRTTYAGPTKLRNFLANQIGKLSKDEFDAMLMSLSREKDYHQKVLAAVKEIHQGIEWSDAKKQTVDWLKSVTAQKESLESMMALIKTGNPDIQWLANHLATYAEARKAYDVTEFWKIMAIHNETDPIKKTQMITDLKSEIRSREATDRTKHAQEIRSERKIRDEISRTEKDFVAWRKSLEWELSVLEKDKRLLEWQRSEIDRQIQRNETSKNAVLAGKSPDASVIATYDATISSFESQRTARQSEIDAKSDAIDTKRKDILELQESHTKKMARLQSDFDRAKVTRETGKVRLDESSGKAREQYAVVDNVTAGHYTSPSHQEAGAARYARATWATDPHIASLGTMLSMRNDPQHISAKRSAVQAELQNPDIQRLNDLERRWLLADLQKAAASVESLSAWAEEALKKLQSGTWAEQLKVWEDYLRGFGEAVKSSNDQIGSINDRMLSSWTKLSKIDQDALLHAATGTKAYTYMSRLASHDAQMKWAAEWMQKNVSHNRPMRFMYGLIGIVAAWSLTTEFAFGNSEVAKNDLKDMVYGFVPGYDLAMAYKGEDLNGRPLKWWDRFERAAWGTLTVGAAIATLGTSSLIVGWLRTGVKWVKAANTLWNIVKVSSSWMAVASVSHFGYNLVGLNWNQVGPNGEKIVRIQ